MEGGDKELQKRDYWNHYFVVRVSKPREWVRWGYAGPGEKVVPMHVRAAKTVFVVDGLKLDFPFELPKGFECDGVFREAKEADRVTSWGWKFVSEGGVQSGEWELAGSMEECLEKAMVFFKNQGLIPAGMEIVDEGGEYEVVEMPEGWIRLQEEAIEAVKSWMSGKGWPKGWKGKA